MKRFLYLTALTFCLLTASSVAFGQETMIPLAPETAYRDGVELLDRRAYAAARTKFENYLQSQPQGEKALYAQYYRAISAMLAQDESFDVEAARLGRKNPFHPRAKGAYFYVADYYFAKGDYKRAQEFFEKMEIDDFQSETFAEAAFKLGYCYFVAKGGKLRKKAQSVFDKTKNGTHDYAELAAYYSAYMGYESGDYAEALISAERARDNIGKRSFSSKAFEEAVKLGIDKAATILVPLLKYKLGRYQEVADELTLMQQRKIELPPELVLLSGEAEFVQGNFEQAAQKFETYLKTVGSKPTRDIYYRLGYSIFQSADTRKPAELAPASTYFGRAADGQDSLAQLGGYHLGLTLVRLLLKEQAIAAFDKCRKLAYDKQLQELGAFYYVKVNYDVGGFAQAIEGCDFYLANFVDGPHRRQIDEFAAQSYLNTGDYATALERIGRIRNPDTNIQKAYQRIAYNKAVQDYNDSRYRTAVQTLQISLRYPLDEELENAANYWLGEIYSYGNRYDSAIYYYEEVDLKDRLAAEALYGIGYAFYNKKDYKQARVYFEDFVQKARLAPEDKKADGTVRLADCNYVLRDYDNAIRWYRTALQRGAPQRDYVYYQMGLTYKIAGRLNEASESFDRVIGDFQNSRFADQAYFQKGMLNFENGRREEAVGWFTKLIDEYDNSKFILAAYSQRAQANLQIGRNEAAEKDLKYIIDTDPRSPFAEDAVLSLYVLQRNGYRVSRLHPDEDKYKAANPDADTSILIEQQYLTASRPFGDGDFRTSVEEMQRFIRRYPKSSLTPDAYYQLGYSYEELSVPDSALMAYSRVEGGRFQTRALRNAAQLLFQTGEYQAAIDRFLTLQESADNLRYQHEALEGLMKSYYELEDYDATTQYAGRIVDQDVKKYRNDAELYKGLVLYEQDRFAEAIAQFEQTVKVAQDANGAEAQYMIGYALRDQEKYQESTKALIEVRKKFESYADWVYEAFLLISENYVSLENYFQAKATLQSIIDYADNQEIVATAKRRLKEVEKLDQSILPGTAADSAKTKEDKK